MSLLVDQGDESLAREALGRKQQASAQAETLGALLTAQAVSIAKLCV